MCIERQNVFSFFLCLIFLKPQTGPNARGLNPEALNEKAEAFLTVAECHHGRREDTESSVHWKEKIWKILHTRDFHRTIFSKKGRSIPHGGRMSPWSSRGHRILGALDGKNLKNSAHERLSQDNFLENTALKVFPFVTEHIDVELRWPSRENVDKSHKIWKNLTSTRRTSSLARLVSARLALAVSLFSAFHFAYALSRGALFSISFHFTSSFTAGRTCAWLFFDTQQGLAANNTAKTPGEQLHDSFVSRKMICSL